MKYLQNFASLEEYEANKDNLPDNCVVNIKNYNGVVYKTNTNNATIVTTTSLKTINGESLIGTGNIVITGGSGGTIDPELLEDFVIASRDFSSDFNNDFAI